MVCIWNNRNFTFLNKKCYLMSSPNHGHVSKITAAGLLVTLGIIYGDIGTSPLYVMSAIIGTKTI